jgi:hypothetical protein
MADEEWSYDTSDDPIGWQRWIAHALRLPPKMYADCDKVYSGLKPVDENQRKLLAMLRDKPNEFFRLYEKLETTWRAGQKAVKAREELFKSAEEVWDGKGSCPVCGRKKVEKDKEFVDAGVGRVMAFLAAEWGLACEVFERGVAGEQEAARRAEAGNRGRGDGSACRGIEGDRDESRGGPGASGGDEGAGGRG